MVTPGMFALGPFELVILFLLVGSVLLLVLVLATRRPPSAPPAGPDGETAAAQVPPGGLGGGTILLFGILGLVLCPALAPVAWWTGRTEVTRREEQGLPPDGLAGAGFVLGVIGTVILLAVLIFTIGTMFIGGAIMR